MSRKFQNETPIIKEYATKKNVWKVKWTLRFHQDTTVTEEKSSILIQ